MNQDDLRDTTMNQINESGTDLICPVCGETYNHRVENGYRNQWPKDVDFAVCTRTGSDWMYVHTEGVSYTQR